jgi:UDP-N-acetylmuramyl pentapeptide phosphotransferase/UDP-N-acetylglucosamine-1-phosphate transferase
MTGTGSPIIVLPLLGLLCAALAYFMIRRLMPLFKRYALARPNARSSHRVPTPQGGGAAVILSALAGVALLAVVSPTSGLLSWPNGVIALATAVLAVVGALDDLRPLPVLPRLIAQTLAAGLGVWAVCGAGSSPLPLLPNWLALGLSVVGLIYFINLTNFMDGIDGISVAEFVPLTAAIAVLAVLGIADDASGAMAAALCGGLLGFAPYNRHVARLFLGDTGSLAIGFLAGVLLLALAAHGQLIAALILPLYYLADATLTLLHRLIRGERITQAHRSHFYQRATDLGWRVPDITTHIAWTNIGLAMLAFAAATYPAVAQLAALAAALALTAWLLWRLARKPLA